MHHMPKIHRALKILHRIENSFVALFLFSILFLAILQITLRNFFNSGLIWGDSLLSILVLWLGLAGAVVASRQDKNINIDVLSQHIPEKYKFTVKRVTSLFASAVCTIISYYSFVFVSSEFEMDEFAFAEVPVWLTESIIPIAFGIMALRYLLQSISRAPGKLNS